MNGAGEFVQQYPLLAASLVVVLANGLGSLALFVIRNMIFSRMDQTDEKLTCLDKKLDHNERVNAKDHAAVREQMAVLSERLGTNNSITSKLVEEVGELKQDVARVDALTEIFKKRRA